MAMVTEQKKSKGQRFGEALQGVGKSINTGIQLADKLKTAETQRDVLNQQKEKLGQDMKVQKSEVMQKGLGTIASIAKTAAEMPAGKERDFFVNQNLAALAAGYEAVGAPVPDKSVVAGYTSMYAEKQSKFADLQASWSKTIKDNPGARTPDQYLQDAYKLLPSLPPEGQAVFSKVFLPNMMEGHQQALLKEEQAGIETEARNRGLVQTKLVDGKKTFEKLKPTEKGFTFAQEEFGKAGGQELAEWTGGKQQSTTKNLTLLDSLIGKLEKNDADLTGNLIDYIPVDFIKDTFQGVMNPEALDLRNGVEGIVFQTLRDTLGSQFTEKEGQKLVDVSLNTKLGEEHNVKRLKSTFSYLKSLVDSKQARMKHMQEGKPLFTYKGKTTEQLQAEMTEYINGRIEESKPEKDKPDSAAARFRTFGSGKK